MRFPWRSWIRQTCFEPGRLLTWTWFLRNRIVGQSCLQDSDRNSAELSAGRDPARTKQHYCWGVTLLHSRAGGKPHHAADAAPPLQLMLHVGGTALTQSVGTCVISRPHFVCGAIYRMSSRDTQIFFQPNLPFRPTSPSLVEFSAHFSADTCTCE
jgi:hypothetical protein